MPPGSTVVPVESGKQERMAATKTTRENPTCRRVIAPHRRNASMHT